MLSISGELSRTGPVGLLMEVKEKLFKKKKQCYTSEYHVNIPFKHMREAAGH